LGVFYNNPLQFPLIIRGKVFCFLPFERDSHLPVKDVKRRDLGMLMLFCFNMKLKKEFPLLD
jgi:hypothetical protein